MFMKRKMLACAIALSVACSILALLSGCGSAAQSATGEQIISFWSSNTTSTSSNSWIPLSIPAAATLALLTFMNVYNDFFWPLVSSTSLQMRTLTEAPTPYSLIKRDVERKILPYCQQHRIGMIVYSPMQSGLLTGSMTPERVKSLPADDWRKHDSEFQEPRLLRNLELVNRLCEIGKRHGKSAGEVAIAWTLHNPAVSGAIVGGRRPDQIERNIGAADLSLDQHEIDSLETLVKIS